MLNEDQRMQMMYTGLANCYIGERNLNRLTSQLLTVVNLAALPILTASQASMTLRYFVFTIGVLLCVFWFFVNQRMRARINYWQRCLAKIEPKVEAHEIPSTVFRVFTGADFEKSLRPPRIYAVNLLPWMFAFLWVAMLVITLFSLERRVP